jgi:hypothetical protein
MGKEIPNLIGFFQGVFTIVMALALTESFKQFVAEKPEEQARHLRWDRFPALLSFLFLIFPFYQGMSRIFFNTYGDIAKLPQPYALHLMYDGIAFTVESALFFVMSRALSLAQWSRFYQAVLILLAWDSFWGLTRTSFQAGSIWAVLQPDAGPIRSWIILNIVGVIVISIMLLAMRGEKPTNKDAVFGSVLMFIRTFADYSLEWEFYFPPYAP